MDDTIIKDGKRLRLGYTTGSCAAAASKAAAWMLLTGSRKEKITLQTPRGILLNLDVHDIDMQPDHVSCSIEKDSGDDPDITRGTRIFARVQYEKKIPGMDQVIIKGGLGIGRVTKPGLDQPVGEAAINSIPRKMIRENVEEVCAAADYKGSLRVIISAPEGEVLAKKTFNPRLGIIGGISILGTTGIVEPMSEDSIIETIRLELKQKRKEGEKYALLTPGNYGFDFIRNGLKLDPEQAVMVSNFIGDSLTFCEELEFEGVLLVGHIGKLVKLAGGMMNTHSKYGDCRMEIIAANAAAAGLPQEYAGRIFECVTCDDALRLLKEADDTLAPGVYNKTLDRISARIEFMMNQKVLGEVPAAAIVFSRETGLLFRTSEAGELLKKLISGRR